MLKMQVPAGLPLAGMVHHKVQDNEWTGLPLLPSDDPKTRELHRPSTAATLNLAAVAAQGSRLFADYDPAFSSALLEAARVAWAAAEANPALYAPAADGNAGGGPYDDNEVSDEFYWAAAELYLTTGEAQFDTALHANPTHTEDLYTILGFDWGRVGALARMDLATVPSALEDRAAVIDSVVAMADGYLSDQARTNFGQPYAPISGYTWGSNGTILNNMVVIATAFDLTGDSQYSTAVVEGMDYLLGRNAMNNSYVSGYGTVYSHNMHSRWFAHQLNAAYPSPAPGTISGGPNSRIEDPLAKQTFNKGCAAQQCYLDDIQSYSTNEMTVNWNSALVWVSAFVDDQHQLEPASAISPVGSPSLVPLAVGGGGLLLAAGGALLLARRRRASRA
jgi:endoglucanase